MKKIILLFCALALVGAGCTNSADENKLTSDDVTIPTQQDQTPGPIEDHLSSWTFPGQLSDEVIQDKQIRITTDKGDIVFELYPDTAPLAVSNFVYLTSSTYFNGLTFHRREEGFQ